ncbi:MAG: hypothetical protein Q9221_008633 [Calogaya cf. arnoldii]
MATSFRCNLLTTILFLCACTTSLVLDVPPQTIANAVSRTPNLRGPDAPPGFTVRILMSQSEPVEPENLYLCAIEAMYNLAEEDWEDVTHIGHSDVMKGLQISYYNLVERPIDLQYKHIVIAVLVAMDTMDRRNEFERTVVELRHNKEMFAIVRLGRRSIDNIGNGVTILKSIESGDYGNNKLTGNNTISATTKRSDDTITSPESEIKARNINTATNLGTPKSLIDPSDHRLNITYTRFGESLDCRILFGASLDALATLAQYDDGDSSHDIFIGINWSGKIVYQTFTDESAYGRPLLTVDVIKRVFRLLPPKLRAERDCGEVMFEMRVEGLRVGAGRLRVND